MKPPDSINSKRNHSHPEAHRRPLYLPPTDRLQPPRRRLGTGPPHRREGRDIEPRLQAVAAGLPTVGVPSVLPLPAGLATVEWTTLAGRTPADLAAVRRIAAARGPGADGAG